MLPWFDTGIFCLIKLSIRETEATMKTKRTKKTDKTEQCSAQICGETGTDCQKYLIKDKGYFSSTECVHYDNILLYRLILIIAIRSLL